MKSKLLKTAKTQEEKDKLREYFLEHKQILDIIKGVLQEDLRLLDKESTSEKRYEEPSWVHKQADYNGSKRQLERLIDLVTIGETNG